MKRIFEVDSAIADRIALVVLAVYGAVLVSVPWWGDAATASVLDLAELLVRWASMLRAAAGKP